MDWLQISSVDDPLGTPRIAAPLAATLRHADAMGLLPDRPRAIARLDFQGMLALLRAVKAVGIAKSFIDALSAAPKRVETVATLLERIDEALVHSPAPAKEWLRTEEVLGAALLASLVGTAPASVRRYKTGERQTPEDVARRLHFLALVMSDLAGAYNDLGVRAWFDRPRSQLQGNRPADLLKGNWKPDDKGPKLVRQLAGALTASPAT